MADFGNACGLPGLDRGLQQTLATLQLEMKRALDVRRRGSHEARVRGGLQSFVEHRAYVPGDDLRHLDWRAYARRGKAHVKLYANEVRGTLDLVLDASASMGYVGAPPHKWDVARTLCYALGLLALRQGDAAGLCVFHTTAARVLPAVAHSHQARRLLTALVGMVPRGQGSALTAVDMLGLKPKARRVVVASDFLNDTDGAARTLQAWTRRGHEVTAVHLVHPDEQVLPFAGTVQLVDPEDQSLRWIQADQLRASFAKNAAAFAERLRQRLVASGVRVVRCSTHAPLGETLRQLA